MGLIKEDKIDFKNYLCIQLINDNKYLYCICKDEASLKVLLIQKKFKLDFQKYVKLEKYLKEVAKATGNSVEDSVEEMKIKRLIQMK